MKGSSVRTYTVRQLRAFLDQGKFAIPRLQREFVWNGSKAAALLDSMYRSMPIGSLIIWRTLRANRDLLRNGLHILPPFNSANKEIWFLIDGQQRLSVIHQAFREETKITSAGREIDFGRLTYWLQDAAGGSTDTYYRQFVFRVPLERELASAADILSQHWKRRLAGLPQHLQRKVERCRRRLLGYRLPVVFIEATELEEVRELFIRINTQGMKIGSADRAFARASNLDLRERAQSLRDELPPSFRDLSHETVLQALALIEGVKDVGERAYESVLRTWTGKSDGKSAGLKAFSQLWGELRRAFELAIDYISYRFSVRGSSTLPSANMLATLSVFFYHNRGQPTTSQRREIDKWFWATGVAQRYSGRGYRENILADAKFFRRLANKGARFQISERVHPSDLMRAEYRGRSALTITYLCLLASRRPRYVTNGEPIPLDINPSRPNRSNQHHIFPKALLARLGCSPREYNSLPNICLAVAQENQQFGSKRPGAYLQPFKSRRHFRRAMNSHLIPTHTDSGLWARDTIRGYRAFRDQRLRIICRAFEEVAGARLFQKY